jgi:hypothetical protein
MRQHFRPETTFLNVYQILQCQIFSTLDPNKIVIPKPIEEVRGKNIPCAWAPTRVEKTTQIKITQLIGGNPNV